jgi:FCD domain
VFSLSFGMQIGTVKDCGFCWRHYWLSAHWAGGQSFSGVSVGAAIRQRITRTKSGREAFECNRRFWDILFENAEMPILWEMFQKLDDRMTRYYPLLVKELYPTAESRPRQHEALIEWYRKGQLAEALMAFKKIYLEMVDCIVDHLELWSRTLSRGTREARGERGGR